jgi:DNA-binding HxlR family transcriptional regulator
VPARYAQYCPVARALEVVGERWTLLVARELLLGPRRFTDLADGLPGISTNVLAGRLKSLEDAGLVARRTLPPPAASVAYELTEAATGLAVVLGAMAGWGRELLGPPRPGDEVRGAWLVLGAAVGRTVPDDLAGGSWELRVLGTDADDAFAAGEVFHLDAPGGHLRPQRGAAPDPDAVLTLDLDTLVALTTGTLDAGDRRARARVTVAGDEAAAWRLLAALTPPGGTAAGA